MIWLISQSSQITKNVLTADAHGGTYLMNRLKNRVVEDDRTNSELKIEDFKKKILNSLAEDEKNNIKNHNTNVIDSIYYEHDVVNLLSALIQVISELNSKYIKMKIGGSWCSGKNTVVDIGNSNADILFGLHCDVNRVPQLTLKFTNLKKVVFLFETVHQQLYKQCELFDKDGKKFLKIGEYFYSFENDQELLEFSGKSHIIDRLEYYCKSRLNNETLKQNTFDKTNLICNIYNTKTYIFDKISNSASLYDESHKDINMSYINPSIITAEIKQSIKDALSKSTENIKRFAAGWKYANIFIEYNATTKNIINDIIDNLDKSGAELDEIIKAKLTELGLMPKTELVMLDYVQYPVKSQNPSSSFKWEWWHYLGLFLFVCALVGGIWWLLARSNPIDNDAVIETSITD